MFALLGTKKTGWWCFRSKFFHDRSWSQPEDSDNKQRSILRNIGSEKLLFCTTSFGTIGGVDCTTATRSFEVWLLELIPAPSFCERSRKSSRIWDKDNQVLALGYYYDNSRRDSIRDFLIPRMPDALRFTHEVLFPKFQTPAYIRSLLFELGLSKENVEIAFSLLFSCLEFLLLPLHKVLHCWMGYPH